MIFHFQIFRWVRIQEILNLDEEDWFAMVDDDSDGDEEDEEEEGEEEVEEEEVEVEEVEEEEEEMDDGEQMNL